MALPIPVAPLRTGRKHRSGRIVPRPPPPPTPVEHRQPPTPTLRTPMALLREYRHAHDLADEWRLDVQRQLFAQPMTSSFFEEEGDEGEIIDEEIIDDDDQFYGEEWSSEDERRERWERNLRRLLVAVFLFVALVVVAAFVGCVVSLGRASHGGATPVLTLVNTSDVAVDSAECSPHPTEEAPPSTLEVEFSQGTPVPAGGRLVCTLAPERGLRVYTCIEV